RAVRAGKPAAPSSGGGVMAYPIPLPPELLRRLYWLRETHSLGPIRTQVVTAVERYVDAMEIVYGTCPDPPGPAPGTRNASRRVDRTHARRRRALPRPSGDSPREDRG